MHFDDDNLVAPALRQWQYAFITFPGDTGMTQQAADFFMRGGRIPLMQPFEYRHSAFD